MGVRRGLDLTQPRRWFWAFTSREERRLLDRAGEHRLERAHRAATLAIRAAVLMAGIAFVSDLIGP